MLRKQIRQMPNLRYTARGRPHSRHRSRMRIFSRGGILTLSGWRLLASSLAICLLSFATFASVAISVFACSRLAERHAEGPEQFAGLVVVGGTGHEGDVHPLHERHLVR